MPLLLVHHLLPGSTYSFRVAAVNSVGAGPWSADSPLASTLKGHSSDAPAGGHDHVPGGGHMLHGRGSGSRLLGKTNDPKVLVVDDVEGAVGQTMPGGSKVDAWAAHWSPKGFKSSGEYAAVEEVEGGGGAIQNKEEVRRVFSQRKKCSLTPARSLFNEFQTHPPLPARFPSRQVNGRIAVVKRLGGPHPVPIVRKVLACQRAGAVAVVVVDETGRCDGASFDQYCVYGADRGRGEGWGQVDNAKPWRSVRVPVVLVAREGWEELTTQKGMREEL